MYRIIFLLSSFSNQFCSPQFFNNIYSSETTLCSTVSGLTESGVRNSCLLPPLLLMPSLSLSILSLHHFSSSWNHPLPLIPICVSWRNCTVILSVRKSCSPFSSLKDYFNSRYIIRPVCRTFLREGCTGGRGEDEYARDSATGHLQSHAKMLWKCSLLQALWGPGGERCQDNTVSKKLITLIF